MIQTIPIQFSDGFVGPPTPRTNTGAGVPDSQNVVLSPDGSSLMPMPGYRRTYPYPLLYKPRAGRRSGQYATVEIVLLAQPSVDDIFSLTPTSSGMAEGYQFYANGGTYTGSYYGVEIGADIATTLSNLETVINANTVLGLTASASGQTIILTTIATVEVNPSITAALPIAKFPESWLPGTVTATQEKTSSLFYLASDLSNIPTTVGYRDAYGDTLTYSGGAWTHTAGDSSILDSAGTITYTADGVTVLDNSSNAFAWFDASDDMTGYEEITNSLLVVSFPPQAFYTGGGVGLGVVDQVTGRVLAIAFHPGGQVPDPLSVPADRYPKLLGKLNRQGPQDAVKFLHFQGLTHLVTPWDEHYVFDGSVLRRCGIKAPYSKPELQVRTTGYVIPSATTNKVWIDASDIGSWTVPFANNGLNALVVAGDYLAFVFQMTSAAYGVTYYDCTPPTLPTADEGYVPVALLIKHTVMSADPAWQIGYMYWVFTFSDDTKKKYAMSAGNKTIPYSKTISKIQLVYYGPAGTKTGMADVRVRIYLQYAKFTAGDGNPLWTEATRRFCFSWYDSARMRESAPSDYSDEVDMAQAAYRLDIGGVLRETGSDWNNANPEPSTVDSVRVYAHNVDWGTDDSGYPKMRLVGTFKAPVPTSDGAAYIDLPGVTEEELLAKTAPQYENNVPPGGAAIDADGSRVVIGNQPAYSVGRCACFGAPNKLTILKCYMNTSAEKVWSTSDPSGKTFTCSTAVTDTAASWKCSDDGTYAFCETWTRSSGSVTAGTYNLYDAYSPTWGAWMEGREINLGNTGKFLVSKALSDHLWMYKPSSDSEVYQGLDYDDHYMLLEYELTGQPNRLTWTSITTGGVDAESTPQAGYKLLDMPGDEIMALGHCGESLVAIGRSHLVYLMQDSGQVDGLSTSGDPYPNPRSDQGGCVSGRTFVQLANQAGLFLGADGKLMSLSSNGAQVLPVSERMKGWIANQFRVSASSLKNAHGVFDAVNNRYVLILGDSAIGVEGTDTSDKFPTWPDQPPLDKHVAWVRS